MHCEPGALEALCNSGFPLRVALLAIECGEHLKNYPARAALEAMPAIPAPSPVVLSRPRKKRAVRVLQT